MNRYRFRSRFVIAAIISTVWFAISSANDESEIADSNLTKAESNIENPSAADSSIPDLSDEWEMGLKGRFGRCTVSRVSEETADFQANLNNQPWMKLKWLSKLSKFQATTIDKKVLYNAPAATFIMTLDETGQTLNVKASFEDELVETKNKELIKSAGSTQEDVDELFDMQWKRRNTFGQKMDGQPIQILGNPISNGDPYNVKENQSESDESDSSKSDSKTVGGSDTDQADTSNQFLSGGGMSPGWAPGMAPSGPFGSARGPLNRMSSADILLVETKEGLSAYSKSLGKWVRLVVGLPKDGERRMKRSTLNDSFCHVLIDDQLFGFSSKAGKWAKLTIPPEYVGKVVPEHGVNMLSATIGDHTYVLSPLTGVWESADESSSTATASIDATPTVDLRDIQTRDTQNAEQKLGRAIDTPESRRLAEAIAKYESQAMMIAEKIRGLPNTSQQKEDFHRDLRQQLEASLSAAFELKLQLEKLRVMDLHSRLSRLEQQIGRRQAQQKQIIERRANELIAGEETEWNSDPNLKARVDRPSPSEQTSLGSREQPSASTSPNQRSGMVPSSNYTQVRFLTFNGAEHLVPKISNLEQTFTLPARLSFERDAKEVRHYPLQLMSGYFDPNSRPLLLDVYAAKPSSEAYLSHNSVSFEITDSDLEYVASGNLLTKVAYLRDSKGPQLAIANIEVIVSSRLNPGIDPIVEAERRGTVLAALRFLPNENHVTEPTRWRPPQASKSNSGQKATLYFDVGFERDGSAPHPVAVTMDENGVVAKSGPDQNSESLVPVPVSFPSGDELVTSLVSAREETAAAQSEFLRQQSLFKNNVTTAMEMASARRRLETATRKEKILKETYHAAIQDLQFQIEGAEGDYELANKLSEQFGFLAQSGEVPQKVKLEAANKSVQARLTLKRLMARYEHYKKLGEGIVDVKGEMASFTSQTNLQPLNQMGVKLAKLSADETSNLAKTTTKYRGGLKVLEVEPGSFAADNGIKKDDILVGLDKWETLTLDNVSWITKQVAERPADPLGKNLVKFFIYRGAELRIGYLPFVLAKETAPQETELDVLPKVEVSR